MVSELQDTNSLLLYCRTYQCYSGFGGFVSEDANFHLFLFSLVNPLSPVRGESKGGESAT